MAPSIRGDSWPQEVTLLPAATHTRVVEAYLALWALLMPLASLLLIPQIQGTIPAFLLAFISPVFCLRRRYFAALIWIALGWALLLVMSQIGLLQSGTREFTTLLLVEQSDPTPVFRKTLLTQSMYLAACVLILLFFKTHYKRHMIRYVFWGAWFLVLYGLFDWGFYMLTGMSGDFLSNRTFSQAGGDVRQASWAQYVSIGPITFLRLKSMTEEPSRLATLAVAYLSLAMVEGRGWLCLALLLVLFLSTSVTGLLGLVVLLAFFLVVKQRPWSATDRETNQPRSIVPTRRLIGGMLVAIAIGGVAAWIAFPEIVDEVILSRLRGEHRSAMVRTNKFVDPIPVFLNLPLINKLFGVGIGTCFLPGSMRMLINCGLCGLITATCVFVYPLIRLARSKVDVGLVGALLVLLFIYTFVSSAVYTPFVWMILGMAYARVASINRNEESDLASLNVEGATS